MKLKKLKSTIKFISCFALVAPVFIGVTSCGNNPIPTITPAYKNNFWINKENPNVKEKVITWNANTTTTITDMLNQINSQMKIKMDHPPIEQMSPFQFGMYLIHFYNNNGGGKIILDFKYNGKVETHKLDITSDLNTMIRSFDSGNKPIRENSQLSSNKLFKESVLSIVKKTMKEGGGIAGLLKLFGKYGEDVFGMNALKLGELFLTDSTGDSKQSKISRLMDSLPSQALIDFSEKAVPIFSKLGQEFSSSPLGKEWAGNNHISEDNYSMLDHWVIRMVLNNKLPSN